MIHLTIIHLDDSSGKLSLASHLAPSWQRPKVVDGLAEQLSYELPIEDR